VPSDPCAKITVQGLVQGVGFRPTVWQLATESNIRGEVYNDGQGVQIIAVAKTSVIKQFIEQLKDHCPPLARIDRVIQQASHSATDYSGFSITDSHNTSVQTGIVADAATCPACLADINDPANRRFNYAFTNCTHCGPRLSIIRDIPYDRANTSMIEFQLCQTCEQEYHNHSDRRFHAQPNACPDCGPELSITDQHGKSVPTDNIIHHCASLLQKGKILAIKGIGGYQLACNAHDDQAITRLRRQKQRPHKALALMARDIDQIRKYCQLSEQEAAQLQSFHAPIVILQRLQNKPALPTSLAPGQQSLGFMLPYSPLHHLLMQQLNYPIVLTSGNVVGQPQCIDNQHAQDQLAHISDYFLHHNRAIVNRVDDSVLRIINGQVQFYRRARGYAPTPFQLPNGLSTDRQILACGGELKNTFALLKNQQITLSQHMGNLENAPTYDDTLKNIDLFKRMYQLKADVIAVDKHPEYLSSKFGHQMAEQQGLTVIEIQHHHAHIAACLAENHWPGDQGKVIGIALDGLGYGDDGTLWGGEFLLCDYQGYQRLARFKPTPMPGGSLCMSEPWRNTLAQLITHCNWLDVSHRYQQLDLFKYLNEKPTDTIQRMIDSSTNSPLTSSCGRLFDAVAAALGLSSDRSSYEGQAAIELEALVDKDKLHHYSPYPFELDHHEILEINPAPMWLSLLQDLEQQVSQQKIASRFHLCLGKIITTVVERISNQQGIRTVALSGGVFQNPTLLELTMNNLQQLDYTVLIHQQVPANDGGISLGQACIAAARTRS